MKVWNLTEGLEFHDDTPYAQPLHVDEESRILRFTLRAGQSVVEHKAPNSPVQIIVLEGTGEFSGGDKKSISAGPGTLLHFASGEEHAIRANMGDLVFLAILHGAPQARS